MSHHTESTGKPASRKSRRALAFVLPAVLAFLPLSTNTADAASICQQIERRLVAVTQTPEAGGRERFDRAIRQSRAAGCGPRGFASPRDAHCRVHAQRIHDLQRFVARSTGFARNDAGRERARLTAALRANGCVGGQIERGQVTARDTLGPAIRTMDGSIPVPLPRPASPAEIRQARYVEHGASRLAALDLARAEELARPRAIPASRHGIRVVGGRFLAQPDEDMNFVAIATGSASPANQVLGGLLAVMDVGIVSSAVAAEH